MLSAHKLPLQIYLNISDHLRTNCNRKKLCITHQLQTQTVSFTCHPSHLSKRRLSMYLEATNRNNKQHYQCTKQDTHHFVLLQ